MMNSNELLAKAAEAMKNSYAPYSKFNVGAALLSKSGKIYLGCNIENSSYGAAVCAERTAFFKAVSESEREFEAIAIVGGADFDTKDECPPCGLCRQVMAEFCRPDFRIILSDANGKCTEYTLAELLPFSFGKDNLE